MDKTLAVRQKSSSFPRLLDLLNILSTPNQPDVNIYLRGIITIIVFPYDHSVFRMLIFLFGFWQYIPIHMLIFLFTFWQYIPIHMLIFLFTSAIYTISSSITCSLFHTISMKTDKWSTSGIKTGCAG